MKKPVSILVTILIPVLTVYQVNPLEPYSSIYCEVEEKAISTTLMNINDISVYVQADGRLVPRRVNPSGGSSRFLRTGWSAFYPKTTGGILFQDGVLWGGIVRDNGFRDIRIGGTRYESSLQPGVIIRKGMAEETNKSDRYIWRIRRDWETSNLHQDAADFFNLHIDSITEDHIRTIRSQYADDWHEWPWQKGAPFYDTNGNGIKEVDEEPGLAFADQVVWYVANDLDTERTMSTMSSLPIGLEMQVTLWAYNRPPNLENRVINNQKRAMQNIIFKRVRLIYKGCTETPEHAVIDSMFIGIWSDPDLGFAQDDLVGCDTTLNIGFIYNGNARDTEYSEYNLNPPSIGYCLLKGPTIPDDDNRTSLNHGWYKHQTNLSMTSFCWFCSDKRLPDPPTWTPPESWYKVLRGYTPISGPDVLYPTPPGAILTKYPLSGDPVKKQGHVDGLGTYYSYPPGDRHLQMNSGPFTMTLGDTQEVIFALIGGVGADRLSSISVMKHHAKWARTLADYHFEIGFKKQILHEIPPPSMCHLFQNHPNPFKQTTAIQYELPVYNPVRLTVYNLIGQEIRVLIDAYQEPGMYTVQWNGTDEDGKKIPLGIYIFKIETGLFVQTRKMLLVR